MRNVIALKLFIIRKFDDIGYLILRNIRIVEKMEENYISMYISIVDINFLFIYFH